MATPIEFDLESRPGRRIAIVDRGGPERSALAAVLGPALLAGVPVLVLDGPDTGGAQPAGGAAAGAVTDVLAAAGDRTVVLITHRPAVPGADALLRHVDEVVTLGS